MSIFGKAALVAGGAGLLIVALARSRAASRTAALKAAAPLPTSVMAPPAMTIPAGAQQVISTVTTDAAAAAALVNAASQISLPWSADQDGPAIGSD